MPASAGWLGCVLVLADCGDGESMAVLQVRCMLLGNCPSLMLQAAIKLVAALWP